MSQAQQQQQALQLPATAGGLTASNSAGSQPTLVASGSSAWRLGALGGPTQKPLGQLSREPPALAMPEEETDNWDDDFEEGISLTKLQGASPLAAALGGI